MKRIDLSPDVRDVAVFDVPVNGTPGLAVFVSIETPTGWYGAQFVIDYPDSHKDMAGKIPPNDTTQVSLKRELIIRHAATASRIPDVMARSLWPHLKTILSQTERVNGIKTPQLELSLYFGQRSGEPIRHHVDQMVLPGMPIMSMGYTPPSSPPGPNSVQMPFRRVLDVPIDIEEPEGGRAEPAAQPFETAAMTPTLDILRRRVLGNQINRSATWYTYMFTIEDLRLMRDNGFPDIQLIHDAIEMLQIPERRGERQEAIQSIRQSQQDIGQPNGPAIISTDAEEFQPIIDRGRTLDELLQEYRDFTATRPSELATSFTRRDLLAIREALGTATPNEVHRAIELQGTLNEAGIYLPRNRSVDQLRQHFNENFFTFFTQDPVRLANTYTLEELTLMEEHHTHFPGRWERLQAIEILRCTQIPSHPTNRPPDQLREHFDRVCPNTIDPIGIANEFSLAELRTMNNTEFARTYDRLMTIRGAIQILESRDPALQYATSHTGVPRPS